MIWLLLSCQQPPAAPPSTGTEVHAWVEKTHVTSGEDVLLHVELISADGSGHSLSPPSADGMEVTPEPPLSGEPAGDRVRIRKDYRLSGEDGSYVIRPGVLKPPQGEATGLPLIFVDVGGQGPRASLGPAEPVPPSFRPAWVFWLVALAGLSALVAWRLRRPPVEEPGLAACVLETWEELRRSSPGDHELSVGLSRIFRGYLDARYGGGLLLKAPSEALEWVEGQTRFTEELRSCARSILTATDRLKFSGDGGDEAFFDELDMRLRQFVAGTRPLEGG